MIIVMIVRMMKKILLLLLLLLLSLIMWLALLLFFHHRPFADEQLWPRAKHPCNNTRGKTVCRSAWCRGKWIEVPISNWLTDFPMTILGMPIPIVGKGRSILGNPHILDGESPAIELVNHVNLLVAYEQLDLPSPPLQSSCGNATATQLVLLLGILLVVCLHVARRDGQQDTSHVVLCCWNPTKTTIMWPGTCLTSHIYGGFWKLGTPKIVGLLL